MKSPSHARPPAAPIETPPDAPTEAQATATVAAPAGGEPVAPAIDYTAGEKGGERGAVAAAPASSSPSASAQPTAGQAIKLTVTAATPMWRCPPEWVRHWPAGETIVEEPELLEHAPEIVEAMIALLDGDANFTVAVDRAAGVS